MKEQVSMMRSACSVLTCCRRWARRRSDAAGLFCRSRPSSFDALPSDCSSREPLDPVDWGRGSGVVIFARGRSRVEGRVGGMSIRLQGPRCAELVCRSSLPVAAINGSSLPRVLCGEDGMAFFSHSKDESAFGAWHFENAWRDDLKKFYFTPTRTPHPLTDWPL